MGEWPGEWGGERVLGILCELAPSQFCFNVNVRTVEVNNDHTKVGVPSHLLDLGRKQVHMSSVCVCVCVCVCLCVHVRAISVFPTGTHSPLPCSE